MTSLQSLACAFAIGLSACVSVNEKVESKEESVIVQSTQTPEVISPIVPQTLDNIIFEGNLEFNDLNNIIPKGTHHLKFYNRNGEKFLEVNYADGSIDKYFGVDLNGKWKYVEEIRGKSIILIPSEYDLKRVTEYIDSLTDFNERRALGKLLYDQVKELKIKREEHQTKLNYYLEKISQSSNRQP